MHNDNADDRSKKKICKRIIAMDLAYHKYVFVSFVIHSFWHSWLQQISVDLLVHSQASFILGDKTKMINSIDNRTVNILLYD